MLDLVGPWEVLTRLPDAKAHLVWTRAGPVLADRGMEVAATVSFEECPALDVLLVPGGPGQQTLMRHQLLMDFLRERAQDAAWYGSVCTGALLLGQAGLLKGRRVATHWLAREALAHFGASVVEDRYVFDDRLFSAAGVSAGIDLALALAGRVAGDDAARTIQLEIEYDPQPPFAAGSPRQAPAAIVDGLVSARRVYS